VPFPLGHFSQRSFFLSAVTVDPFLPPWAKRPLLQGLEGTTSFPFFPLWRGPAFPLFSSHGRARLGTAGFLFSFLRREGLFFLTPTDGRQALFLLLPPFLLRRPFFGSRFGDSRNETPLLSSPSPQGDLFFLFFFSLQLCNAPSFQPQRHDVFFSGETPPFSLPSREINCPTTFSFTRSPLRIDTQGNDPFFLPRAGAVILFRLVDFSTTTALSLGRGRLFLFFRSRESSFFPPTKLVRASSPLSGSDFSLSLVEMGVFWISFFFPGSLFESLRTHFFFPLSARRGVVSFSFLTVRRNTRSFFFFLPRILRLFEGPRSKRSFSLPTTSFPPFFFPVNEVPTGAN